MCIGREQLVVFKGRGRGTTMKGEELALKSLERNEIGKARWWTNNLGMCGARQEALELYEIWMND